MSIRSKIFTKLLDQDGDGFVTVKDAVAAFTKIDGLVNPHGWKWTLGIFAMGFATGYVYRVIFA